jgi:hypothetical protein
VSLLNIQLQIQRNPYPIDPSPNTNGIVRPGRNKIMKTVNTRKTQNTYSL